MLPITIAAIAAGIYIRVSEFEREAALVHLIALAGCQTIETLVPGPFYAGGPGYHPRNDPDRDGVACGTPAPSEPQSAQPQTSAPRAVGNAKFLRP
ncbi:excalibur calcium-binding domain-containing protein [Ruegeria sp.]|uniref:excalibur calcium-binding domain-containing protein n=1 Tax=Ruegeria sp. TaxID=1879320 RepID=UPI003B5B29A6